MVSTSHFTQGECHVKLTRHHAVRARNLTKKKKTLKFMLRILYSRRITLTLCTQQGRSAHSSDTNCQVFRHAKVNSTVRPLSHPSTSTAVHKLAAFTCHFPPPLRHASGRSTGVLHCKTGSVDRQLSKHNDVLHKISFDGVQLQHITTHSQCEIYTRICSSQSTEITATT